MEAPEKIYVSTDPFGFLHAYDCENHPPIVEEYIRKDAFIEKAANYLNYILYDRVEIINPGTIIPSLCAKGEFVEDFKSYMEK